MKKRIIIYALLVFVVGLIIGGIINLKKDKVNASNNKTIVSGYSFETTKSDIINKKLDADYLDSFVTVALKQNEFTVNLEGIDSNSKVFIINPKTGEMINMKYNNGKFFVKTKFAENINYGIIKDYKLIGSIRVVNNLNSINKEKLFKDILISLGCGL